MYFKKIRINFLCIIFILSATVLMAQPRDHILVNLGTDLRGIALGQINAQLQITPLPFIGIVVKAGYKTEQRAVDAFTKTSKSIALGGELRLYPFGAPKLYDVTDFLRYGFRSEVSMGDSWAQIHLSGLYVGLGYEHRKIDLEFIPDQSLNSPWPSFDYNMQDHGASLQLGYHLVLNHFSIDVGYRLRFSQPEWQGPVDIFEEDLYTKTHPVTYRQTAALQINLGAAF